MSGLYREKFTLERFLKSVKEKKETDFIAEFETFNTGTQAEILSIFTVAIDECSDEIILRLIKIIQLLDSQSQTHILRTSWLSDNTPIKSLLYRKKYALLAPVLNIISTLRLDQQAQIFNLDQQHLSHSSFLTELLQNKPAWPFIFPILDLIAQLRPEIQLCILSHYRPPEGVLITLIRNFPKGIHLFLEIIAGLSLREQGIILSGRSSFHPDNASEVGNRDWDGNNILMVAIQECPDLFLLLLETIESLRPEDQAIIFTDRTFLENLNVLGLALKYRQEFVIPLLTLIQRLDPEVQARIVQNRSHVGRNGLVTAMVYAPKSRACSEDLDEHSQDCVDGVLSIIDKLSPADKIAILSARDESGHNALTLAVQYRPRCLAELIRLIKRLHPIDQQYLLEELDSTNPYSRLAYSLLEGSSIPAKNLLILAEECNPHDLELFFSILSTWPKEQQRAFCARPVFRECGLSEKLSKYCDKPEERETQTVETERVPSMSEGALMALRDQNDALTEKRNHLARRCREMTDADLLTCFGPIVAIQDRALIFSLETPSRDSVHPDKSPRSLKRLFRTYGSEIIVMLLEYSHRQGCSQLAFTLNKLNGEFDTLLATQLINRMMSYLDSHGQHLHDLRIIPSCPRDYPDGSITAEILSTCGAHLKTLHVSVRGTMLPKFQLLETTLQLEHMNVKFTRSPDSWNFDETYTYGSPPPPREPQPQPLVGVFSTASGGRQPSATRAPEPETLTHP